MAAAALGGAVRRAADQAAHWMSRVSLLPPPRAAALLPASGASAQRDWADSRIEVVCREPLIIIVHELLRREECRAIIQAAQRHGRPMMGGAVDARDQKYDLLTWPLEEPTNDAGLLLEAVYDRIDAMCGIGRQPGEVPPKVVFSAPRSEQQPQVRKRIFCAVLCSNRSFYQDRPGTNIGQIQKETCVFLKPQQQRDMPLGLHVDTNAVGTYVTALLYLTSVPAAGDGATVFPCAGGGPGAEASCSAAAALLEEQALHTGAYKIQREHCFCNAELISRLVCAYVQGKRT